MALWIYLCHRNGKKFFWHRMEPFLATFLHPRTSQGELEGHGCLPATGAKRWTISDHAGSSQPSYTLIKLTTFPWMCLLNLISCSRAPQMCFRPACVGVTGWFLPGRGRSACPSLQEGKLLSEKAISAKAPLLFLAAALLQERALGLEDHLTSH